jgi:hypothetical protein
MKTIANRMIVFAASALAFVASGTSAFGQTRVVAEIPFAFHTVNGTLPAGTYEIRETGSAGTPHVVLLRNTSTEEAAFAGNPVFDAYRKASTGSVVEFACAGHDCSLKAVRTNVGSLEYSVPRKSKDGEKMAVISIAMRPLNAD